MKGAFLTARIALVRLAFGFARHLPLRSKVVLATSHTPTLTGNLACIAEALERDHPTIQLTILASRPVAGWGGRLAAAWQSVVAGYHLATARLFVVDDYYFPLYVVTPRAGTTVVQTWHASGAFKRFGYSVLDKSFGADEALIAKVPIHSHYDVCLVSSMSVAPHYAEAFRQPLDRFRSDIGIPRTDDLYGEAHIAATVAAVRAQYGIAPGRRIVLYAPTFRGDSVIRARYDDSLDLPQLRSVIGEDHVVLVRLHPFIRAAAPLGPELAGFAIDASDHPAINDLLLASDVLITDYSSVIYEFSLLARPIAFFAPDDDAYEDERGFYLDYQHDLPGPIFKATAPLAAWIRAGAADLDRVRAFRDASFDVADGHATQRFIERIVRPAVESRA